MDEIQREFIDEINASLEANGINKLENDCLSVINGEKIDGIYGPYVDVVIASCEYTDSIVKDCISKVMEIAQSSSFCTCAEEAIKEELIKDDYLGVEACSRNMSEYTLCDAINRYVNNYFEKYFCGSKNANMVESSFIRAFYNVPSPVYFRKSCKFISYDEMLDILKAYFNGYFMEVEIPKQEKMGVARKMADGFSSFMLVKDHDFLGAMKKYPFKGYGFDRCLKQAAEESGFKVPGYSMYRIYVKRDKNN